MHDLDGYRLDTFSYQGLDAVSPGPMSFFWPTVDSPASFLLFSTAEAWQRFLAEMPLHSAVPDPIRRKYVRAQKLYAVGWIDQEFVKAGELVALTALELALTDCFGSKPSLSAKLRGLVVKEGLRDEDLPSYKKYGSRAIVGLLDGTQQPTLSVIRNGMAHGDPYGALPISGLLELVRDLIEFVYRDRIAAARSVP